MNQPFKTAAAVIIVAILLAYWLLLVSWRDGTEPEADT